MCSYLLKNKSSELVLAKIKSYIRTNNKCEIFQTDNGKEFNNQNLKIYLENNDIKIYEVRLITLNQTAVVKLFIKKLKNFY